jgi:hypothetical protein
MLEQSCTFVNAYYGILDYEWLKPQYIGGTHKNNRTDSWKTGGGGMFE